MKNLRTLAPDNRRTLYVLAACILIIMVVFGFTRQPAEVQVHNLECRARLQIVQDNIAFSGLLDLKTNEDKGIVNINGIITDENHNESTVQRTILFTHMMYGQSPVWTSQQIYISSRETAASPLIQKVLPDFFLKQTGVSDVDLFRLNRQAWLITKEDIPYVYCTDYQLAEDN